MTAIEEGAVPAQRTVTRRRPTAGLAEARDRPERLVFALPLGVATIGIVVGFAALLTNGTDTWMGPLLLALTVVLGIAVAVEWAGTRFLDWPGLVLTVLVLASTLGVLLLPTWMYGYDVSGIVHRTVVSGPLLLVFGVASASLALRRLLSASPSGQDLALVPVLVVPMLIGGLAFLFIIMRVVLAGIETFRFDMIVTAWGPIEGTNDYRIGYLNNILGSFLLIGLTLLFAILPGVGAGVFMSEYPGRVARLIGFCTTMLRAIAVFIFGAVAISLVYGAGQLFDSDSFLSLLIRGGWESGGRVQPTNGSFVLAAFFLALLVLPVIARLTEEGLRSAPREMREGSVALGATDGYGLRRILIPWAMPNILTGLVLAGAEAAGGLAVIMFLGGLGEQGGVGLLNNVTDLDYAVFAARFGPIAYSKNANPDFQMIDYQNTAALLLLVLTVTLTVIAMLLQRHFAKRYRGSITV